MNNTLKSILIADDDPINRKLFQIELGERYELQMTIDGNDCLNTLSKTKPDLLILDIKMPNLNGFQVCERVRNNQNYDNMPIIFVSALQSDEEQQKAFIVGGNDYLSKPYNENSLLAMINRHLNYA